MTKAFVHLAQFDRVWKEMGLDDEDLRALEDYLLEDPEAGDVIPGLGGARKIRIPLQDHGKRGGGRVVYVNAVLSERIYLITAYAKNIQEDLNPNQKKELRKLVEYIKKEG